MSHPKVLQEEECLNIYWKIKNFSYVWEEIRTPEFIFDARKWCLRLKPEVIECELVDLKPTHPDWCRNDWCGNLEISFLTCDASKEEKTGYRILEVSKDKIFGQRRRAFLPKDTLTVRCRIQVYYTERGRILFQSRIGVKRSSILWALTSFSQRYSDRKVFIENSDQYGDILLNLASAGGINCDKHFYIEISRESGEKCYCVLKVSVLGADKKPLNYVSDEFVFQKEDRKQIWRFPPIIRNSKLLACKNLILPNDTLTLKCDFVATLGKVTDQTVVYTCYEDMIDLLKNSEDLSKCSKEESRSTDLKTDLKRILDNGILCDVNLRIGPDVIQAHKNILSARSPVFKAMFTKDMKEAVSKIVVIEDLDADTVGRLLLYMYTDIIYDYQRENITNLYFAADKYEVLGLKQMCSSFLKENLSFSNVCEVLFLADLHQDAELKLVVHDFISKYESEVFASEAWKELEKNNSSLACQTLREMYANKRLE